MNIVIPILIGLSLVALVAVLATGIISMMKGGEFNKKYGNKLMQARVALQTIVIALLALSYFLSHN